MLDEKNLTSNDSDKVQNISQNDSNKKDSSEYKNSDNNNNSQNFIENNSNFSNSSDSTTPANQDPISNYTQNLTENTSNGSNNSIISQNTTQNDSNENNPTNTNQSSNKTDTESASNEKDQQNNQREASGSGNNSSNNKNEETNNNSNDKNKNDKIDNIPNLDGYTADLGSSNNTHYVNNTSNGDNNTNSTNNNDSSACNNDSINDTNISNNDNVSNKTSNDSNSQANNEINVSSFNKNNDANNSDNTDNDKMTNQSSDNKSNFGQQNNGNFNENSNKNQSNESNNQSDNQNALTDKNNNTQNNKSSNSDKIESKDNSSWHSNDSKIENNNKTNGNNDHNNNSQNTDDKNDANNNGGWQNNSSNSGSTGGNVIHGNLSHNISNNNSVNVNESAQNTSNNSHENFQNGSDNNNGNDGDKNKTNNGHENNKSHNSNESTTNTSNTSSNNSSINSSSLDTDTQIANIISTADNIFSSNKALCNQDIDCFHNGTCKKGQCICPNHFWGVACQFSQNDIDNVKNQTNATLTQLSALNLSNVSNDSLGSVIDYLAQSSSFSQNNDQDTITKDLSILAELLNMSNSTLQDKIFIVANNVIGMLNNFGTVTFKNESLNKALAIVDQIIENKLGNLSPNNMFSLNGSAFEAMGFNFNVGGFKNIVDTFNNFNVNLNGTIQFTKELMILLGQKMNFFAVFKQFNLNPYAYRDNYTNLSSKVIQINFKNPDMSKINIDDLTNSVELLFDMPINNQSNNTIHSCVFFNETSNNWTTSGLQIQIYNNINKIACQTRHFSSFSLAEYWIIGNIAKNEENPGGFKINYGIYACFFYLSAVLLVFLAVSGLDFEVKNMHVNFLSFKNVNGGDTENQEMCTTTPKSRYQDSSRKKLSKSQEIIERRTDYRKIYRISPIYSVASAKNKDECYIKLGNLLIYLNLLTVSVSTVYSVWPDGEVD